MRKCIGVGMSGKQNKLISLLRWWDLQYNRFEQLALHNNFSSNQL
jgi:hypothetical protein